MCASRQGSLLILLVVLGIIFVYYPLQQARATRAEVEGRGSALARTVALGVAIGLESGDLSVITETFESAKRDPDLVYMQAVDDGDEPFATYNPSEIGVDNRGLLVVGESPEPMEILHLSAPLSYQNVGFGTLFLGISLEAMSNQIAADRANACSLWSRHAPGRRSPERHHGPARDRTFGGTDTGRHPGRSRAAGRVC